MLMHFFILYWSVTRYLPIPIKKWVPLMGSLESANKGTNLLIYMKKIFHLLFASMLFIGCSSDSDQPIVPDNTSPVDETPVITEGMQAFEIDFKEIQASKGAVQSAKDLVPAFVLVSINDDDGNVIRTREKIALQLVEGTYVSDEITLDTGVYSITEFIVTDADDVVISITPKVNSVLAQFTENALPFNFTVETDLSKVTAAENINADGFTAVDFGYGTLNLEIPAATDFFSLTVDESSLITPKSLVLKSITGSSYVIDWGDGTIEDYASTSGTQENVATHTYAQGNQFTITVSGPIEAIEEFEFYSDTAEGNPLQSNLTTADITKMTLLKKCHFYSGMLTTLDTSSNTALEQLELGYNQLTSLDLSNNPNLKMAYLRYNQLTVLDLSQNTQLEYLGINENQISGLDISNNSALTIVYARTNGISSLIVSNNTALELLDLSGNLLSGIDVSNNTALTSLNVGANALTAIDLSNNTNLTRIDLYTNQLTAIDLSQNMLLTDLYIDGNLLDAIDLSNNTALKHLIVEDNNLSSLDITLQPNIIDLQIGKNQFNGAQLDGFITQLYDQAVLNSTMQGYIDFQGNPGFGDIDATTSNKINELTNSYQWSFNNNQ